MILISQLIKGISGVLQKLFKSFNGTAISISFEIPLTGVLPIFLVLNLNYSESVLVLFGSSLQNKNKLLDVFE